MSKGQKSADKGALLQGTLDLLVLRILAGGPKHGFGITRRLNELSGEWLQVDEGSLYPCLYRLEERGCIRSEVAVTENKRRARYYTMTTYGEEQLEVKAESWRHLAEVVSTVLQKG